MAKKNFLVRHEKIVVVNSLKIVNQIKQICENNDIEVSDLRAYSLADKYIRQFEKTPYIGVEQMFDFSE